MPTVERRSFTDPALTLGEIVEAVNALEIQHGGYAFCTWITDESPQRRIKGLMISLTLPEHTP